MALESDSKKMLRQKVEDADLTLTLQNRHKDALAWAEAQFAYSEAMLAFADVEEDDVAAKIAFSEAAEGFKKTLQIFTQKQHFSRWGRVVISYVRCIRNLAMREEEQIGILRFKNGLLMLQEVFEALDPSKGAFDRALIQSEKGHLYRALADVDLLKERENNLQNALNAYENSASFMRKKENFTHWSVSISAGALTAAELGRMQKMPTSLETVKKAISLFESVLAYDQDHDRLLDRPYLHFEMGRTLFQMSILEGKNQIKHLQSALHAFELAHSSFEKEKSSDAWVRLQNEMAMTLSLLAQYDRPEHSLKYLERSLALYKNNLDILDQTDHSLVKAVISGNYGKDLSYYANTEKNREESLKIRYQAIDALRDAIGDEIRSLRPLDWLSYFVELGAALQAAANDERTDEKKHPLFREAIDLYSQALNNFSPQDHQELRAKILQWRALARATLGEAITENEGLTLLKEAERDFRLSLKFLDSKGDKNDIKRIYTSLAHLLYAMACRFDCDASIDVLHSASKAIEYAMKNITSDNAIEDDNYIAIMAHHGLILSKIGFFEKQSYAYIKAEAIYEKLITSQTLKDNPAKFIQIMGHYARMLHDWTDILPRKDSRLKLRYAFFLIGQVEKEAKQFDLAVLNNEIHSNRARLEQRLKSVQNQGLARFWPFKKRVN
ncbi:hypothetical protein [Bartonella tamiae]|uniref:Uncharacterized protein n=1 Tax=Bartonella tamiae Th239 TaxID=1094558 RepID=J1K2J1_9HYPH|nr:hypothetical protein [Bartonella tamiae]EJF91702.1 hypothetical protein ME5_00081 [Bartonella tamiae Th239]EJF92631.1 hypothetical protein MEG_01801 [Bartonella tamiae Th307]